MIGNERFRGEKWVVGIEFCKVINILERNTIKPIRTAYAEPEIHFRSYY